MPLHSTFLRYFDGVCRYGSIRKAATQLHISPTAINRSILNYENEINHKLFERTNEGMKLTTAGRLLYAHISRTLNDAQTTLNELEELRDGDHSQVKVGGAESIISTYLPSVMVEFFKANPDASTSFTPCSTEQAVEMLEKATIDIAIIFDPIPSSRIDVVFKKALSIGAVLLPDHPLANLKSIKIDQCVQFPVILPEKSWPLRHQLDRLFEQMSLTPNVVMECGSTEILQSMISAKIGVGFHTIMGIERCVDTNELHFIPLLAPKRKFQQITLCIHPEKPVSSVLQSMIDLLIKDLQIYTGR